MAYIQPNRSPPTQPFYYSPYPTSQSFSSRSSPSSPQTYVRSPPTSTSAAPRSRTLSTPALPSSYGYAHPTPPQEPPNPFAEMGIDPVRMYLQSFSLPDTPENRRDAWEIVGRVAQRILDREEEEARARQSTYDEDDTDYAEFLAFKEYKRQKDRSHRSSESPARESGHRPYSRQYYPGQNPGAQVPQAGYCPSPPAQQPMLFSPGPVLGHGSPSPASRTHYYSATGHGPPAPGPYPKTPVTVPQSPLSQNTTGPTPNPAQTATSPWLNRPQRSSPLGRPQKTI